MHAASVNPEPGSNSLKKLYLILPEGKLKPFSELFSSFFLLFELLCFQSVINEISALFSARNFMLFNFQGTMRSEDRCALSVSLEALDYYTSFMSICQ